MLESLLMEYLCSAMFNLVMFISSIYAMLACDLILMKMHVCVILIMLIKLCNFILTHPSFFNRHSLTCLFIEIAENSKRGQVR